MATLRTVTVKPSGGDYTSLNAALVGESADLVSLDRLLRIEPYAMLDTTVATTGAGYTTDATRNINITVPAGESHSGVWDATKYRLVVAYAYTEPVLRLSTPFTRVSGIQVYQTITDDTGWGAIGLQAANCFIEQSIGRSDSTKYLRSGGFVIDGSGGGVIRNCLAYGCLGGAGVVNDYAAQPILIDSCTFIGNGRGVWNNGGDGAKHITIRNTLCSGNVTADFSIIASVLDTASNNASSDTTAPGANARVNQTFTFVDAANKNYQLASTDAGAKGYGADLSALFTTDITGATRTLPWDSGAFKAATGGGAQFYSIVGSGGLATGGAAGLLRGIRGVAGGGAVSGGAAGIGAGQVQVGAGGAVAGGLATGWLSGRRQPVGGGVTAGGEAVPACGHVWTATGGAVSGGGSASTRGRRQPTSGGLVTGGQAPVTFSGTLSYVWTAAGGLLAGGAGVVLRGLRWAAGAGSTAGGTAKQARGTIQLTGGGLATGGGSVQRRGRQVTPGGGLVTGGSSGPAIRGVLVTGSGGGQAGGGGGWLKGLVQQVAGGLASAGQAVIAWFRGGTVPPASRTATLRAEPRCWAVAAERRVAVLSAEARTLKARVGVNMECLEPKDPNDAKDYAIEWAAILAADGETEIKTSEWLASVPAGLLPGNAGIVNGTKTVIWLTGGVAGLTYQVTNRIVTPAGRTYDRTIVIPCIER